MLKIGEFSKIARMTVKALRYYDETGLLKPEHVDASTGYRYYSSGQLLRLYRIITLKNAGFSLTEIKSVVETSPSAAELRQIMRTKERELSVTLQEVQGRLSQLAAYLKILEQEENCMNYSVITKQLPGVTVASFRTVISDYSESGTVYPRLAAYMAEQGCEYVMPAYLFTIYHDGEYRDHDIDLEICQAVVAAKHDSEQVKFKQLATVPLAACVLHQGPYQTIGLAYGALHQWIEHNGYEFAGPPRESYIDGAWNKQDPSEWLTEVQAPIKQK